MPEPISLFNIEPIRDHLSNGTLIITPNQRLSSRISNAYALDAYSRGHSVVASPNVISIAQWINQCWQRLIVNADTIALSLFPLSADQEHALWESIVVDSALGSALLRPKATAQQAMTAYKQLVEWRQDLSDSSLRDVLRYDEDASTLLKWADEFNRRCAENQWLPGAKTAELVLRAFKEERLKAEETIIGLGFEDLPPLNHDLLHEAGNFSKFELPSNPGDVEVVACESLEQELHAAAVWAKQVVKHDERAVVAVIVPELSSERPLVERVFLEVFEPDLYSPNTENIPPRNLPFNFSAGYPLADASIIIAALDALSLVLDSTDRETLTTVCQSPFYLLNTEDFAASAKLIKAVYRERSTQITTARFRQLAEIVDGEQTRNINTDSSPMSQDDEKWPFALALQSLANLSRSHIINTRRSLADWVPHIVDVLEVVGWPGTRRLDSVEYQQVKQWNEVLASMACLDQVLGTMDFSGAISQLRSVLSRRIFQAESNDSPVQVLGILEAAGLQFSHLWLSSMSERQWPPAPSPNPLLPYSLQRRLAMPHATAERELGYAENLTRRIISSAKTVIVSSPSIIDDQGVMISPLYNNYPTTDVSKLLGRPLSNLLPLNEIQRRFTRSRLLETFEGGRAPALAQGNAVKGGASVFANQAACPFKAFSKHRLNLQQLPKAEISLSAADRGSILHRACELIWMKLKSQESLLMLDQSQQQSLCDDVSTYAVNEICTRFESLRLGMRFRSIEISRISNLLNRWLELEKERESFTVVETESKHLSKLGHLELENRIDRIDRLADDSYLIIDYKTGKSTINRWWGSRPDEPQLPLYQMLVEASGKSVSAIAFAEINPETTELKGVGSPDVTESKLRWKDKYQSDSGARDWESLKTYWSKSLEKLGDEFIGGLADVAPKSLSQSCRYCEFSSVCRIGEALGDGDE